MDAGCRVTVVTSRVQYMTGEDLRPGAGWCAEETVEGIRILRAWALPRHRGSIFRRVANYVSFALLSGAAALMKVKRVDRLFAGTDPIFLMPVIFLLSLLKRAPMVLDERDLYPETAIALRVVSEGMLTRFLSRLQMFFRGKAAALLAATPGIRRSLLSYGCPEDKVILLYNADPYLLDNGDEPASRNPLHDVEPPLKGFLVGYTGGLGRANDIGTLLRAAVLLRDDDVTVVIVGDGELLDDYRRFCREHGLVNVRFLGPKPRDVARAMVRGMDVCVILLHPDDFFCGTLPSKTFDYLGLGTPVIFSGQGDTAEVVRESGGGVTLPPGDEKALADAVRMLRRDEAARNRMEESARAWYTRTFTTGRTREAMRTAMNIDLRNR